MDKIFSNRIQKNREKNIKNLRLIFNEQFVGFLLISLSYLFYLYFSSLNSIKVTISTFLFLVLISILIFNIGSNPTFLKEADRVFLLGSQKELKKTLNKIFINSTIKNVFLQISLLIIPSFAIYKLFGLYVLLNWIIFQVIAKVIVLYLEHIQIIQKNKINFDLALKKEQKRVIRNNFWLNMFFDTGVRKSVHPTEKFDFMLSVYRKKFSILFSRRLYRSREYVLNLFIISILGILLVIGLEEQISTLLIVFIIIFAFVYQLKNLYSDYDQNIFVMISDKRNKNKEFLSVIRPIIICTLLIFIVELWLKYGITIELVALAAASIVLIIIGLPKIIGLKNEITN